MSRCPTEERLAGVAAEEIHGKERDALLAHVIGCARCRDLAERYNRLKFILSHARRGADGKLTIEMPSPSAGLRERIHQAVRQESQQKLARKNRIRGLVEELLEDLFSPSRSVLEGVGVGYFATKPGPRKRNETKIRDKQLEAIRERTTALLETIADPDLPDSERLKLLDRLLTSADTKTATQRSKGKRSG